MNYPRWKFGAGVAVLALGLWLVPTALSNFSGNASFTTSTPVQGGASADDGFAVSDGTFEGLSEDTSLGSTNLSDYRLSMDGSLQSVGGLGDTVANYRGDYTVSHAEAGDISTGTFEMQAASSLSGGNVLLNAQLTEQNGAGSDFDGLNVPENLMLSAVSADGTNFSGSFGGGSISGSGIGAGDGWALDGLTCLDLMEGLCCCENGGQDLLPDGEEGNGDDGAVTAVPEPSSFAALGLLGAAAMARRRRR